MHNLHDNIHSIHRVIHKKSKELLCFYDIIHSFNSDGTYLFYAQVIQICLKKVLKSKTFYKFLGSNIKNLKRNFNYKRNLTLKEA